MTAPRRPAAQRPFPARLSVPGACSAALILLAAATLTVAATTAQAQPEPAVTMPAEKVKPAPAVVPAEVGKPLPATSPAVRGDDGAPLVRGDMRHRCGGIGSDESTAMRAEMKNHPLSLLFAQEGGAYMANVDVTIRAPAGQPAMVFRADGPVCLIDLPAGKYEVTATRGEVSRRESVTVGEGAKTVDFRFP